MFSYITPPQLAGLVSEGDVATVIIRNEDKQKQDVNELNRDTEHANDGSINPIFDKEKEQNRLKQSQLIGEIGNQTMDIIRTQGDIEGLKAQKNPDALAVAKKQLEADGKIPTDATIKEKAYNNAMAQYGTGSDFQKAAQAVTGLLQGLAGDNLAGALANASSPYLATLIKKQVGEDNKAANAMAHAVLGAVVAELNNQSAAAGGLGAGGGELAAHVILDTLFPGKKVSDLSESEKQQVSALSQLAAGLAGGLTTGDVAGAVTAAQAGKNAVENNYLSNEQQAKKDKELDECSDDWCRFGIHAKWLPTDAGQDASFGSGMLAGLPAGLYDTVEGFANLVSNPGDTYDALRALINSGDILGNASDAIKQSYIERIDRMEAEYQRAGAAGSFNAGVEAGKLIFDAAAVATGAGGVAKGTVVTTEKIVAKVTLKTAVKAEKEALERIAYNSKNSVDLSIKPSESVLQRQAAKKIDNLAVQFNNSAVHPKDFQLNINGKTMVADAESSLGAPVFKGATDADVITYFKQLTGTEKLPSVKVVPGKGNVYSVKIKEGPSAGSTITLRDFSTSAQQTGAKWTIDLTTPSINGGRRVEVKFK